WVRKKYDFKNKFVVMYMGAHGVANGLSLFVDAAKALEKYEDIVFMLVGDGMEKPKLKERASKYNLKNLIFVDSQPKSKIVDYCVAADVCCAILKKVETFKTVYPNKIFDYMACAKPIIIAIDGVARELIERAKAGIYVEPENVTEFVNAVLKLYNDRNSCAEYGENGFKFVKRYYSREKLAQEYERILEELMANE
ncbi:MAG TPA: glycosyltransferase WbuB, partial [bacterium (Candidatus Stahlbacteria)]|nr:glycosyltransferase WbuB [Candidatus Stahlbacteria bacterium]